MLFVNSAYEAAEGADALLVLTEWDEFKHLDYARVRCSMPDDRTDDGACGADDITHIYNRQMFKNLRFQMTDNTI